MSDTGAVIPVLRFRAGSMDLGIAAEDVASVVASDHDVPHIATVLGLASPEPPVEQRIIQIAARGDIEPFAFAADAPVRVVLCRSDDVLPVTSRELMETWRPVMGFASIDGRTVALLDIPSIAERLLEQRGGGYP